MKFMYELVPVGSMPTWDKNRMEKFHNPVQVGDKVKPSGVGSDVLVVASVEHYTSCSVLFVEAKTR